MKKSTVVLLVLVGFFGFCFFCYSKVEKSSYLESVALKKEKDILQNALSLTLPLVEKKSTFIGLLKEKYPKEDVKFLMSLTGADKENSEKKLAEKEPNNVVSN